MHPSNFRPSRSQQLFISEKVRENLKLSANDRIVVHHVIEDTPLKLIVQVEYTIYSNVFFKRVSL